MDASLTYRAQSGKGMIELDDLTRRHTAHGGLGDDTLQIANTVELVVDGGTEGGVLKEIFHYVEALLDGVDVLQGEYYPPAEQTTAHRCHRPVDDTKQRGAVFLQRTEQFEAADGELVEAHKLILLDAGQRRYVRDVGVLGELKVLHDGSRGHNAVVQMVDTETFQRLCAEMLQKFLARRLLRENPVVELKSTELCTEKTFEIGFAGPVVEHLLRLEVANELLDVVVCALTGKEFSGGNIEEADAARTLSEVHSGQKVVLLVVKDVVAHGNTGCDKLRDAAAHHLVLGRQPLLSTQFGALLLWVLELVANGNTLSGTDELGQIGVESVVGETGHLSSCRCSVVPTGQRNAENARRLHGIIAVGLIEIATAEEQ